MHTTEKTLAIIKPDAVTNNIAGKIISSIEEHAIGIAAMKMVHLTDEDAKRFYSVHTGKSFFDGLVAFMSSAPCIALVLEGDDVLDRWRSLMGPTDPRNAPPESIRRRFGTDVRHNATHGSDSPESATEEIAFFFSGFELKPSCFSRKESDR